jgi:hypothetical protein
MQGSTKTMSFEELADYLIRHGWDTDTARAIHDAYYAGGCEGAADVAGADKKRTIHTIVDWQREVTAL